MKNAIKYTLTIFLYILFLYQNINGQINLCSGIEATHLSYNNIGGIQVTNGLEFHPEKNYIILNIHFIYAVGNQDFEKEEGELYSLVDGANREEYPLPGIIPGLDESAYIKALKLNTAKTMDVGFAISYGRVISKSDKHKLRIDFGINFSWVEESSIKYEYKGDLTNVLGTSKNIYLVTPYTQNFFDLGPQLAMKYNLMSKNNSSFGLIAGTTWLIQSGFKLSFGPTFCVNLN